MPKSKLSEYDNTAANNTDVGGVNTAEGMSPADVNDAIRELMSHLADFADGTEAIGALTVAGSGLFTGALSATPSGAGHVVSLSGNESRIRAYGATAGTGYLTIRTGGGGGSVDSEALRVTAAGSVQVGSSSSATNKLFVYDNDASDSVIYARQDGAGPIQTWHGSGGAEMARVDSSGRLGLGTASPTSEMHLHVSGANDGAQIKFDSDYGIGYVGQENNTSNNLIIGSNNAGVTFYASDTERMRITSAGNVGIGCSPTSKFQVQGATTANNIEIGGNWIQSFNRGATPGYQALPIYASQFTFFTGGTERLRVTDNGLTFNGDTAAANALDDYEEGTWTPTVSTSTSATAHSANYTKIGRMVNVQAYVVWTNNQNNNSSSFQISGLPFAGMNVNDLYHAGSIGYSGDANTNDFSVIGASANGSYIYFHQNDGDGASHPNSTIHSRGLAALIFSITYMTA